MTCNNCENILSVSIKGNSKVKSKASLTFGLVSDPIASTKVKDANLGKDYNVECTFISTSKIKSKLSNDHSIDSKLIGKGKVRQKNNIDFEFSKHIKNESRINTYLDKFVGNFKDFSSYEKIYPSNTLIDEGVFSGKYHLNNEQSSVLYKDVDNISISGSISLDISNPTKDFKNSNLILRISSNASYLLHNIYLKDASNNIVYKYRDFEIIGDGQYTTYSLDIVENYGFSFPWSSIDSTSFKIVFEAKEVYNPKVSAFNNFFDDFFDAGSKYIKLSALEVLNFGNIKKFVDISVPVHVSIREKGERLERFLKPKTLESNSIYPSINSLWKDIYDNYSDTDTGKKSIANQLSEDYDYTYATLVSPDPSGTLQLKFDLSNNEYTMDYRNGEFAISFDNAYDKANLEEIAPDKSWFLVDEVFLKIRARKRTGGQDFPLDVVGWSDDGLLNISTPFNFLDNYSDGSGVLPTSSGWLNLDNEAIAGEAISDLSEYFEQTLEGANHYKISNDIIVNSESFSEYIVPLKILQKETLGLPKNYGQSPSFESLKLNLFPIPSGASISSIKLGIRYRPSNALSLNSLGGKLSIVTREDNTLKPTTVLDSSSPINSVDGSPGFIENIPHGYTSPPTLKTNYSRRWKGIQGEVFSGPFNPTSFDFGFSNPQLADPFLYGYYDFSNTELFNVLPKDESYLISSQSLYFPNLNNKLRNLGLRQKLKSVLVSSPYIYDSVSSSTISATDAYDTTLYGEQSSSILVNPNGFTLYTKFTPSYFGDYWDLFSNTNFSVSFGQPSAYQIQISNGSDSAYIDLNSDEQYPLYIFVTYNEKNNGLLSLYVIYDSNPYIQKVQIPLSNSDGTINIYNNAYIHELGFSTNNFIDGEEFEVDYLNKEIKIQDYIRGKLTYWPVLNEEYVLPDYINESTYDFDLGAFKYSQFTSEFDFFTNRVGKDFIQFNLIGNTSPYPDNTDLSYDTQLENDFLRFNLTDTPNNLYSTSIRIEKGLTEGYIFNKKAIVAETIIDYSHDGADIIWEDGSIGPKFIVSLYCKNNYSEDRYPDIPSASGDFCLINKKEFYLDPYMSWERLDCTFDPDTYWGYNKPYLFNEEFKHRFFKEQLDSMFLQYDLQVPTTVDKYKIKLNIHAANVRLENALVNAKNVFDSLNIFASGEYISSDTLNLVSYSHDTINNNLNLHALGSLAPIGSGYSNLVSLGGYWNNNNLNITTISHLTKFNSLLLNTLCQFEQSILNIVAFNNQSPGDFNNFVSIYTYAEDQTSIKDFCNFVCFSSVETKNKTLIENSDSLNLFIDAYALPESKFNFGRLNVFMSAPQITDDRLNLFLDGEDIDAPKVSNKFNLHSITYPVVFLNGSGAVDIMWNTNNFGRGTEEFDESFLSIPASADIRDQEGICWGECQNSGTCIESALTIHDIDWIEESCIDGGIARPFKLNDSLVNPDFYDGGFYGARKYTGLIPDASYDIKVKVQTGSNRSFSVPTKLEEVEYGTLGNIKYSGVKLFDNNRHANDNFGKAVKTVDNIAAISAPNKTVESLQNAGSVFLYRRQDPINSGDKANWILEEEITLPSGLIHDYYYNVSGTLSFEGIGTIPQRQWEIGQEGREFGYSLDIAKNNNRELLAVGAPGAKWSRTFDSIQTSGINFGLFIFSDEFSNTNPGYFNDLWKVVDKYNFLFKYFSANPKNINMKLINIFPTGIFGNNSIPYFENPNIITKAIPRSKFNSFIDENVQNVMLSGMKEGFFEAFPFDSGKLNNNIPPFIAFYVDNSQSMGRASVEPAIDRFLEFYETYSFNSGVKDVYNINSSGLIYEKVLDRNIGEDHFTLASGLIQEFFDKSITDLDIQKFITSGIGNEFNLSATEFNLPPSSGGRVYLFEKTGSEWNLIQELSNSDLSDRFGHCVSLSKDTNTLVVSTPYHSKSMTVYEYKDTEKTRLYNAIGQWLKFRNDSVDTLGQYTSLLNRYINLESASGTTLAGQQIYSELNKTDKFKSRSDKDFWGSSSIKEFDINYSYGINDLLSSLDGQFKNVVYQNAPNPRLGFSSSINEDGSLIILGSPTDSIGIHDNADFYFKHEFYFDPNNSGLTLPDHGTWLSNLNAGAVRVFEKNKKVVIPNNSLVVEYNKFGNLSNTLNGTEIYDENGNELNTTIISKLPNYIKTDFSDFRIPDEASAIFIITPEVDAVNDETIGEIKRWLALGDRRLILVGDDPIWEKGGAYAKSNTIINKILERLESKMRLHAARNEYEALLIDNNTQPNLKANVIESFIPFGSNKTTVKSDIELNAFGVADIKLHCPDVIFTSNNWGQDNSVVNNRKYGLCKEYNPICTPFIGHNCDLRTEWTERDFIWPLPEDGSSPYVYWKRNIPFEFFSNSLPQVKPQTAKNIALDININDPGTQPRPILVAAEFESVIGIIPAKPAVYEYTPIYEDIPPSVKEYYLFSENELSNEEFVYSEDSLNINYIAENVGNNPTTTLLFNPDEFLNKDAIIQGKGSISTEVSINETLIKNKLDDKLALVCSQALSSSEVFLIATVTSENQYNLSSGGGNDFNIAFYNNLVKTGCQTSNIVQLGGWTGRNSFKEGYSLSMLLELFNSFGHIVQEGWSLDFIPETKDVVWIANAANIPTDSDISIINSWLQLGNKKLIITYDGTQSSAYIAKQICDKLSLQIKPWFVPNEDKLAFVGFNNTTIFNRSNIINYNNIVTSGCSIDSKILSFTFDGSYCPINAGNNSVLIYNSGEVFDRVLQTTQSYKDLIRMNTGITKVQFPVIPGSGYRIYYRWYSDSPGEDQPLYLYFGSAHYKSSNETKAYDPSGVFASTNISVYDFDATRNLVKIDDVSVQKRLESPSFGSSINKDFIDIQIPSNINYLNLYITGNSSDKPASSIDIPKTCKLLDVKGHLLPIDKISEVNPINGQRIVGYNKTLISEEIPASSVVLPPVTRPIMTDNTKYCINNSNCGNQLVADGPVLVAEEPETFSDFNSGNNRSTIVLISDSSLINGRFQNDIYGNNQGKDAVLISNTELENRIKEFIKSLINTSTNTNYSTYSISNKIVSPEIGSPALYGLVNSGCYNKFVRSGTKSATVNDFVDESIFDENKIVQHIWPVPPKKEETWDEANTRVSGEFSSVMNNFGINSKMKYSIEGTEYEDSPIFGNLYNKILQEKGYDFLSDILLFSGSYPGDLFGHSVSIIGEKGKEKIVVSAPFNGWKGEDIISYSGVSSILSNLDINISGGAGSVFTFERYQNGWEVSNKIKPSSCKAADCFGYVLDSDSDILVIGSPNHDYNTNILESSGSFVRKEFDAEFNIGTRNVLDSGNAYNNIGAIYVYENSINNFTERTKKLSFIEKVNANGYQNYQTNSRFGRSIGISRNYRADSDYSIITGSNNNYGNSGVATSGAGAAYINDLILRYQPNSIVDNNSWFSASVFGNYKDNAKVSLYLDNLDTKNNEVIYASGKVYSDNKGQIFIEVSGQDPRDISFIDQRPFVESVEGYIQRGTPSENIVNIHTEAVGYYSNNNVNLHMNGPSSDIVYNSLNISSISTYSINNELNFVCEATSPLTLESSGLIIHTSGIGILNPVLNLRIRGK